MYFHLIVLVQYLWKFVLSPVKIACVPCACLFIFGYASIAGRIELIFRYAFVVGSEV